MKRKHKECKTDSKKNAKRQKIISNCTILTDAVMLFILDYVHIDCYPACWLVCKQWSRLLKQNIFHTIVDARIMSPVHDVICTLFKHFQNKLQWYYASCFTKETNPLKTLTFDEFKWTLYLLFKLDIMYRNSNDMWSIYNRPTLKPTLKLDNRQCHRLIAIIILWKNRSSCLDSLRLNFNRYGSITDIKHYFGICPDLDITYQHIQGLIYRQLQWQPYSKHELLHDLMLSSDCNTPEKQNMLSNIIYPDCVQDWEFIINMTKDFYFIPIRPEYFHMNEQRSLFADNLTKDTLGDQNLGWVTSCVFARIKNLEHINICNTLVYTEQFQFIQYLRQLSLSKNQLYLSQYVSQLELTLDTVTSHLPNGKLTFVPAIKENDLILQIIAPLQTIHHTRMLYDLNKVKPGTITRFPIRGVLYRLNPASFHKIPSLVERFTYFKHYQDKFI